MKSNNEIVSALQPLPLYCVLVVWLLMGLPVAAQEDSLLLRNGTILPGKVLKYSNGSGALIVMPSQEIKKVPPGQIEAIRFHHTAKRSQRKPIKTKVPKERTDTYYNFRETGWYGMLYGGTMLGLNATRNVEAGFGMHGSCGYAWNRWVGLGLGLGLDTYTIWSENSVLGTPILPIFTELRGYLSQQPRTPYYMFSAGYSIAFKDEKNGIVEATGGVLLHPAIGFRLGAREDTNFVFDIGYRFQRTTQTQRINGWQFNERLEQRIWYKRLCLRAGVVF